MTEIEIVAPDGIAALRSRSTEELRAELARALSVTADHLAYLAAIWLELEQRGEDLSGLRSGVAAYLPMIAAGRLDAEAVVRFAGSKTLLRAVALLPLDRQRALAQGETVPVALRWNGEIVVQNVPAETMTVAMIRTAFDEGRTRPLDEQKQLLAGQSAGRRPAGAIRRVGSKVKIGRNLYSPAEIVRALGDLFEPVGPQPAEDGDFVTVLIRFSKEEHRDLRISVAEAGSTNVDLIRSALAVLGIISRNPRG